MFCLQIAAKKFNTPEELTEIEIEKYIYWKIEKHGIGSSYQRMIVASIDKFYDSVVGRKLSSKAPLSVTQAKIASEIFDNQRNQKSNNHY